MGWGRFFSGSRSGLGSSSRGWGRFFKSSPIQGQGRPQRRSRYYSTYVRPRVHLFKPWCYGHYHHPFYTTGGYYWNSCPAEIPRTLVYKKYSGLTTFLLRALIGLTIWTCFFGLSYAIPCLDTLGAFVACTFFSFIFPFCLPEFGYKRWEIPLSYTHPYTSETVY